MTALYPARLACDDRASIACARVMRGKYSSVSSRHAPVGHRLNQRRVLLWREQTGHDGAGVQLTNVLLGRDADDQHDIGAGPGLARGEGSPGIAIGVIAVGGGGAGTGFDEDFHAGDGQALQCRRHERDAGFASGYFVGHEKFHGCP